MVAPAPVSAGPVERADDHHWCQRAISRTVVTTIVTNARTADRRHELAVVMSVALAGRARGMAACGSARTADM